MTETGEAKLSRAERRVVNKAASAKRHAEREAVKASRAVDSPPKGALHALRAGAGAREAAGDPLIDGVGVDTIHGISVPGAVVLADQFVMANDLSGGQQDGVDTARRRAVVMMRANGFTKKAIASVLSIDEAAIDRDFRDEYEHGFARVAAAISSDVTASALAGNQKDQHFWLRANLGWSADRRPSIVMGVVERELSPDYNKPWSSHDIPAPGPDGKIHIKMRIGIPDREDDEDMSENSSPPASVRAMARSSR